MIATLGPVFNDPGSELKEGSCLAVANGMMIPIGIIDVEMLNRKVNDSISITMSNLNVSKSSLSASITSLKFRY